MEYHRFNSQISTRLILALKKKQALCWHVRSGKLLFHTALQIALFSAWVFYFMAPVTSRTVSQLKSVCLSSTVCRQMSSVRFHCRAQNIFLSPSINCGRGNNSANIALGNIKHHCITCVHIRTSVT